MRRYRTAHPDRRDESRKYWLKYKNKISVKERAKRVRNPQYYREYNKKYWEKNKDRLKPINRARNRRWYEENKAAINAHAKAMKWQQRALEAKAGRPKPDRCEVCGDDRQTITWDHCHQRGIFRGWICTSCNKILGFANDDQNRLRKLIAYLERTKDLISPQLTLPL